MNTKLKLFTIFLAISAILSVFSFFDIVGGVRSANLVGAIATPEPQGTDADQDGLSDADESYWGTDLDDPDSDDDGFLDGEEVVSNFDPSQAGPGDSFEFTNLTERISTLAVSGLAEAALKIDHPDFEENSKTLVMSVIDDGIASFVTKMPDLSLAGSDKESQEKYIIVMGRIWSRLLSAIGSEVKELDTHLALVNTEGGMATPSFIDYFNTQRIVFYSISQELTNMPVPSNWSVEHSDLLSLTLGLAEINKALSDGYNDPIRATLGLRLFVDLLEKIPAVVSSFEQKAQAENISSVNLF